MELNLERGRGTLEKSVKQGDPDSEPPMNTQIEACGALQIVGCRALIENQETNLEESGSLASSDLRAKSREPLASPESLG